MRSIWLILLLVIYGLFALFPAGAWLAAELFDFVDDGWQDWLPASVVTWPVALGLGAFTLAAHGLLLNAHFRAEAADQLDELEERQLAVVARSEALVPVGGVPAADAVAGGDAAAGATVAAPRGSKTAPVPRGEGKAAVSREGRGGRRGGRGRRYQRRALSMARRQMRHKTGF